VKYTIQTGTEYKVVEVFFGTLAPTDGMQELEDLLKDGWKISSAVSVRDFCAIYTFERSTYEEV